MELEEMKERQFRLGCPHQPTHPPKKKKPITTVRIRVPAPRDRGYNIRRVFGCPRVHVALDVEVHVYV